MDQPSREQQSMEEMLAALTNLAVSRPELTLKAFLKDAARAVPHIFAPRRERRYPTLEELLTINPLADLARGDQPSRGNTPFPRENARGEQQGAGQSGADRGSGREEAPAENGQQASPARRRWAALSKELSVAWRMSNQAEDRAYAALDALRDFRAEFGAEAAQLSKEWLEDAEDWRDELRSVDRFRDRRAERRREAEEFELEQLMQAEEAAMRLAAAELEEARCREERERVERRWEEAAAAARRRAEKCRQEAEAARQRAEAVRNDEGRFVNPHRRCWVCGFPGVREPRHCPKLADHTPAMEEKARRKNHRPWEL